jgi:hypothetical protein
MLVELASWDKFVDTVFERIASANRIDSNSVSPLVFKEPGVIVIELSSDTHHPIVPRPTGVGKLFRV